MPDGSSTDIDALERALKDAVVNAADLAALDAARVAALGKKGEVTALMKTLGGMTSDERAVMGPRLNALKNDLNAAIEARRTALEEAALDARLASERVDVTLPAPERRRGRIHPISQVMDEIQAIFADLGFAVAEGPDIEDDFHNFTALNFPPHHPAREMHDTFFLKSDADGERKVLRTHTSPVQIRTLLEEKPPVRIIAPGRTYRCDSDQTHTPMFHQVEGLAVGEGVHMGHLKGTLEAFIKAYFEIDAVETRLRPSYFPFTEPSAELDVRCDRSGGRIKIGEGNDWMEILGCGMVHPNVLRNCGVDPEAHTGFAFGMGVDRLAMLKYGMPDLRDFFAGDPRWVRHYGFDALDQPNLSIGMGR